MKHEIVDRETAPRYDGGCDYSRDGEVLLRNSARRLVWRGGAGYASGRQWRYGESHLSIIGPPGADYRGSHRLTSGGRLSQARLAEHMAEIDGRFGEGATELAIVAHLQRKTVVLTGEPK